ncbi:unnamed protein product, partial [Iphiclides podalirius]
MPRLYFDKFEQIDIPPPPPPPPPPSLLSKVPRLGCRGSISTRPRGWSGPRLVSRADRSFQWSATRIATPPPPHFPLVTRGWNKVCCARFIRAGKGRLLLHRGYTFRLKNNLAHGRKQWYCSSRLTSRCLADVNTEGPEGFERIVRSRYAHNHAPPNVRRFADGRYVVRTPHQSGHRAPAALDPHHQLLQLQHALALYAAHAATANATATTSAATNVPAQHSPNSMPAAHAPNAKPLLVDTPCIEED